MTSRPKANSSNKSSATPSRSEIESALSGRTSRSTRKAKPAASNTFDLNAPPRRQQVIGGDLTGVTGRQKFGIFSRYSDISITNWIAAGLVLLIIAAFFWPQGTPSTQEIAGAGSNNVPQLGETDLSEDEIQVLTQEKIDESNLSFSRDDDLDRAGDYRAQDAQDLKTRNLLEQATLHIQRGEFASPSASNAVSKYREILAFDPRNVAARQGIDAVNSRFLTLGLSALTNNDRTTAENYLSKLGSIDVDSEEYIELSEKLGTWKVQRAIASALTKADSAFNKKAYILPAKENALYYYQQVLELSNGTSDAAIAGIQKIADLFIEKSNQAIIGGQFQAASAHLATVSIIDPSHASIPLIEAMIARAKPLSENVQAAPQQPVSTPSTTVSTADPAKQVTPSTPVNTGPTANSRTPSRQTNEQQAFDKQYLKQGLEAYYKGDYQTAAALLQPLADKGIARAQFRLAYMYFLGRGYKRDRKEADSIIRTALPAIQKFANDGRAWAQSDLGSLYEDGLVLPRNYTDAVFWYRSAAEQGYPGAQTNLGIMYARGRGVNTSRRTAIQWFQRAAKQGDRVAQRNLEAMGASN